MKKFLSLVLALIMVMSLVTVGAGAVEFSDAEEITQVEAVGVMSGLGIITGANGAFDPQGTLTRGAAAKIITYMLEGTVKADAIKAAGVETTSFSDVPTTSSNAAFIEYCAMKDIVGGYSDGTFRRSAPVTGNAFLKMVLVALGVTDIDFNSSTNPGWPVDAVTRAKEMKLLDDIASTVVYSANLTRENACAIALAGLQYSPTGSAGYVITAKTNTYPIIATLDDVYESKTDAMMDVMVFAKDAVYGTDYIVEKAPADDSLGTQHFDLTETTKVDAFGRVYDIWTNGLAADDDDYVEYACFAPEAVLTITEATTANGIRKALGYETDEYKNATFNTRIVNGKNSTAAINTGNGTVVEVYKATKTDDVQDYTLVIYNTYVEVLTEDAKEIVEADEEEEVEAHIWIDLNSNNKEDKGETVETTQFEDGDVVIYTVGKNGIETVELAETVTGEITAIASDKSYFRLDGEKKALSAANTGITIGQTTGYKLEDDKYTYYLDNYGYVIYAAETEVEEEEVATTYTYVYDIAVDYYELGGSLFTTEYAVDAQVKVIDLATGELVIKNLGIVEKDGKFYYATKTGAKGSEEITTLDEKPAAYTNGDKGIYEYAELEDGSIVLVKKADTIAVSLKKDVVNVAAKKVANASTVLSLVEWTEDEDGAITGATVTTTTGVANFPSSVKNYTAVVEANDNGTVSTILVVKKADAAPDTSVNYAIYKEVGETDADGTLHTFYVGGEEVMYYAAADAYTDAAGKIFDIKVDEDNKITSSTEVKKINNSKVTVVSVEETYMVVESGSGAFITIYFDEDGCAVYNADDDYAVDTLAAKDKIWVYDVAAENDVTEGGNRTWKDVTLVIIDND